LALLSLWLPFSAQARDHLLRWIVPPEPSVAGYNVYLSFVSGSYGAGTDIGFFAPDGAGIASYMLTGLDPNSDYFVVMTAYDGAPNESVFSNEISIPALGCSVDADCDDGNACNGTETCQSSTCVAGTAPVCAAPTQCMQSFCDIVNGCTQAPEPNGTACDDGDPGTVSDTCGGGVCQGVVPACTTDAQCSDGNACNGVETCQSFSCVSGTAPVCAAPTQCMQSFCDVVNGCTQTQVPDGTVCDDGDPATIADECGAGVCQGFVPECAVDADCDDANLCTVGTCEIDFSCTYAPVLDGTACYDFDPITIGDFCFAGSCEATCQLGVNCGPGVGAQRDYLLSWALPVDPNLAGFNIYLRFEGTNYGEPLDVGLVPLDPNGDPFYPLRGLDSSRTYYAMVTAYDDTGAEWFVDEVMIAALACNPAPCDDGDSCTADSCTATSCTNQVLPDDAPCDDGDPSTILDTCFAGICGGVAGNCTTDAHCDDGNVCTGVETCQSFSCVPGTAPTCAAPTQCIDSFCDAATGCGQLPRPDGTSCDDGDPFTVNDVCSASGTLCQGVVGECQEVVCEEGDFWCELTKFLSEIVGEIDSGQARPCL
jgi:hypothetical protein